MDLPEMLQIMHGVLEALRQRPNDAFTEDETRMMIQRVNSIAETFARHNQTSIQERTPSQNSPEAPELYPLAAVVFKYLNNNQQSAICLQKSVSHAFDSPENLYFLIRALSQ